MDKIAVCINSRDVPVWGVGTASLRELSGSDSYRDVLHDRQKRRPPSAGRCRGAPPAGGLQLLVGSAGGGTLCSRGTLRLGRGQVGTAPPLVGGVTDV